MANSSSHSYVPYQVVSSDNTAVRSYLIPYLRNWPWYVLSLMLAMAGGYVYLLYKQPIYRIQASLMLQDEKRGNGQSAPLKEIESYSPKKVVENELEVLKSSTLMEQVVSTLHLDTRYFRNTKFGKREIYTESPVWILVESGTPELYKNMITLSFPTSKSVQINNGQVYPLDQPLRTSLGKFRILTRQSVDAKTEPVLVQAMPAMSAVGMYSAALQVEPTSKT